MTERNILWRQPPLLRTPLLGSTRTLPPTTSMWSTARWLRVHDVEVGHREHAEDGRLSALDTTRREGNKMVGTRYTSGMLAAFAKPPRLRRMDVKVEPDGREIAFYSRRYADGGGCAQTRSRRCAAGRVQCALCGRPVSAHLRARLRMMGGE